jgi:hypothetical protein
MPLCLIVGGTVLRAVVVWLNAKILNRSNHWYCRWTTQWPKFLIISWGFTAPHLSEVVEWRSFVPVFCWANAQPTPNARVPRNMYQSMRCVQACKGVPFGNFIDKFHPMGSYPSKTIHFGDKNEDFQRKRLPAYLSIEKRIIKAWWHRRKTHNVWSEKD